MSSLSTSLVLQFLQTGVWIASVQRRLRTKLVYWRSLVSLSNVTKSVTWWEHLLTHSAHSTNYVVHKVHVIFQPVFSFRGMNMWKLILMNAVGGVCRQTVSSVSMVPSISFRWVVSFQFGAIPHPRIYVSQYFDLCVCVSTCMPLLSSLDTPGHQQAVSVRYTPVLRVKTL